MSNGPTRKTSEEELNQFNVQMRADPGYQELLRSFGFDGSRPVGLSRSQQGQVENYLKSRGIPIEGGMHIDNAGNVNQKNRLVRNAAIAAGIAAGGYFAAPAIAGALGAGGAAGGAGTAAGAGSGAFAAGGTGAGLTLGGGTAAGGGGLLSTVGGLMGGGSKTGMALNLAGKLLSGGAKGSEQSRLAADSANAVRDRTSSDALSDYERNLVARGNLDVDQRKVDSATRDSGYKQALRAQALQNWTPAQRPSRIPMVTGGFNTIPQASRDFAKDFEQQAMVRALQGEKFDKLPPVQRFNPTPVKEPSLWEKLSGAAGLGLQGASAVSGLFGKNNSPNPFMVGDADGEADSDFA